jgi:DNA primase
VVALAQYGVGYAVATLGTATTPVHITKLLRQADEIVFCFDGDAAGRKAAWRALEVGLPLALDHKPLRFLFLPDGEDPDTYVRKHGKEAFERLAREAQTLSAFLVAELRSRHDLASAEGRSAFIAAAKPYLQKVEAPALKLQLVKEVAALARVTQEEAEGLLEIRSAKPVFSRPAPARAAPPAASSQERNLLRCVIVKPDLAAAIDTGLLDERQPETAALLRLVDWVENDGVATEAVLIERFQGTEHEATVFEAQASVLQEAMTQESAERQFDQIQLAMRIRRKNEEYESLMREASGSAASRELLLELDRRAKELASLRQQRL